MNTKAIQLLREAREELEHYIFDYADVIALCDKIDKFLVEVIGEGK